MPRKAIIVGAGPAGLTAAMELLERTDVIPQIYESTGDIGGISKTKLYRGNRIDIGGHRFFSKSERVMDRWTKLMPLQGKPAKDYILLGSPPWEQSIQAKFPPGGPDPECDDLVMLVRNRLSRIYYLRRFFDYPLSINFQTLVNLGFARFLRIGASYVKNQIFPLKNERNLEDFFRRRFGDELYRTFFRDYTEKVWGVSCREIGPEWGAQRVKGLSITRALINAFRRMFTSDKSKLQKSTETSLINRFMYPKWGPGQMWEELARRIQNRGGTIHLNQEAVGMVVDGEKLKGFSILDVKTGRERLVSGDFYFSTMAIKDLIAGTVGPVPEEVRQVASGLYYRDFMTAGLLLKKLRLENNTKLKTVGGIIPDNWIYVQEKDAVMGRIQIFNNWSPYMVADLNNVWMGLEYFVNEGDETWNLDDDEFLDVAAGELEKMGMAWREDVIDGTVIRMKKAYPGYFGTFGKLQVVKDYVSEFPELFLIGRNGMHRYNNMDHSMLTAIMAVENIIDNNSDKENIWQVNTEQDYYEKNRD